jgi:hypothetical protein
MSFDPNDPPTDAAGASQRQFNEIKSDAALMNEVLLPEEMTAQHIQKIDDEWQNLVKSGKPWTAEMSAVMEAYLIHDEKFKYHRRYITQLQEDPAFRSLTAPVAVLMEQELATKCRSYLQALGILKTLVEKDKDGTAYGYYKTTKEKRGIVPFYLLARVVFNGTLTSYIDQLREIERFIANDVPLFMPRNEFRDAYLIGVKNLMIKQAALEHSTFDAGFSMWSDALASQVGTAIHETRFKSKEKKEIGDKGKDKV